MKSLPKTKQKKLSETAQDLFHLIHSFRKNENITNFVKLWMLEDPIQKAITLPVGLFNYIFTKTFFFLTKTANYTVTTN